MNRTFRIVWSHIHHGHIVAPETARGGGKKSRSAVIASALMALFAGSGAAMSADLPTGGQVVAGSGTLATNGSKLTINQATSKLAIDWQTFNIGQGKTVEFVQPSSSAVVLNRVLGTDVSVIQGALQANGQVFLVNPNGVLFTPSAQINVGGIVASTLNLRTDDFMAGNYRFEGTSASAIINKGNITASPGGAVALIAAKISNVGQIHTERGSVLMGAGSKVQLDLGGPVKIEVEEGALDALIEQGGGVRAHGGMVYLTAKAVGQLTTTVINHTGITQAQTLATGEQGQIYLMGGMDKDHIVVGGKLDASAPHAGGGGFIETSASKVAFAGDLKVTTAATHGQTGQWLIDPEDFTVAASGGDITGASLGTLLGSNNVTIQTGAGTNSATQRYGASGSQGDIFVNDGVSWSSGNTLTLKAYRHIQINSTLDALDGSGGKVVLEYGQGAVAAANTAKYTFGTAGKINLKPGTNFSTKLGSDGALTSFTVLDQGTTPFTNNSLNYSSGKWALGADVDFTAVGARSGGFVSENSSGFILEGLGHTLSNISIAPNWSYQGFIGQNVGTIRNLSVQNLSFSETTRQSLGFIGYNRPGGVIENITVSGTTTLSCQIYCGSIVGWNKGGTVRNFSVSGDVTFSSGTTIGGGVVGMSSDSGVVIGGQSSAAVSFAGSTNEVKFGGIIGLNAATLSNVTFSGTLSSAGARTSSYDSDFGVGGIAGAQSNPGQISSAVFTGSITLGNGARKVGGIAGEHYSGSIIDSTSSGTITVGDNSIYIGGVAGRATQYSPWMMNVAFRGDVTTGTGSTYVGGLIGLTNDSISSSSASGTVSIGATQATSLRGTSPMYLGKLFGSGGAGATSTYFQTPITVSASPLSIKYGETPFFSFALTSGSLNDGDTLSSILTGSPLCVSCVNVGTYSNQVTQNTVTLSSNNYILSWQNGTLTITKAPLTVTADNKSRTYGAANPALTASITGFVNGENLATSGVTGAAALSTAASASTGVGTADIVAAIGTLAASNYYFNFTNGTLTITKAPLTVTADNKSRTYGAANPELTASIAGFVNGEDLATSGVTGAAALSTAASASTGVGMADIVAALGTLAASNYDFYFTNGTLTIIKAPLTVTADAQTKRRGTNDPALSFQITSGALVGNDTLTGELSRMAGEDRGKYEITRGTLSNSNYDINFIGNFLTVSGTPPSTLGESSAISSAHTMPTDSVKELSRPALATTLPGLPVGQATGLASTQAQTAGRSLILIDQPSNAPETGSAEAPGSASNRSSSTVVNPSGAGRDALGFMRVGVVNGGVNIDLSKKAAN